MFRTQLEELGAMTPTAIITAGNDSEVTYNNIISMLLWLTIIIIGQILYNLMKLMRIMVIVLNKISRPN